MMMMANGLANLIVESRCCPKLIKNSLATLYDPSGHTEPSQKQS